MMHMYTAAHYTHIDPEFLAGLALVSGVIGLLAIPFSTLLNRDLLRTTVLRALGLAVLCAVFGVGTAVFRAITGNPTGGEDFFSGVRSPLDIDFTVLAPWLLKLLCAGLLPFAAVPLLLLVFLKWSEFFRSTRHAHRTTTSTFEWATPACFILALLSSIFAWQGFDMPIFLALALPFGALLTLALQHEAACAPTLGELHACETVDSTEERRRVLTMLQEGKINVEESAELLGALSESSHAQASRPTPITGGRRMLLAGAAFVLVGFLLPWFSMDLSKELERMAGNHLGGQTGGIPIPSMDWSRLMQNVPQVGTTSTRGGDIPGGLGWIVLALGLGTAMLPFIGVSLTPIAKRNTMIALLIAGSAILLYLISGSIRYVAVGIPLVCVGYVFEFAGSIRERAGTL